MCARVAAGEIDAEFRARGLEPVAPFTRASDERECACTKCGTTRWVRLANLRKGGVACRWCSGWDKWGPWAAQNPFTFGAPQESLERLLANQLAPLTEVRSWYEPVGVVCLDCGETFVAVPSRLYEHGFSIEGCQRCLPGRRRAVREDAVRLYSENGLRLLEPPGGGDHTRYPAECMGCGAVRRVSYDELKRGAAPLCFTCTHGIRPDEPHRVYLFHFPLLKVMKVGLTHNRHDRRLFEHDVHGGTLVDSVVVPDRESARRLEALLKARYATWATTDIGPTDFPQGGWTETWRDDAPIPSLAEEAALILK